MLTEYDQINLTVEAKLFAIDCVHNDPTLLALVGPVVDVDKLKGCPDERELTEICNLTWDAENDELIQQVWTFFSDTFNKELDKLKERAR